MATNIQLPSVGESGQTWPGKVNGSLVALKATADAVEAQVATIQDLLNGAGPGTGTPATGAITNFNATVLSHTSVQLTWGYTGSSLTSYTLTQDGTAITAPASSATSITITGLAAGSTHTWTLRGNFTAGGSTGVVSVTRTTTSGAATITLTAVKGVDYADLTWTAVSGSTGYKVGHDTWNTIDPPTTFTRRLLYLSGRDWTGFVEAQPSGARAEVALNFATPGGSEPPVPPVDQPDVEPGGLGMMVFTSTGDQAGFPKDLAATLATGSTWIRMGIPSYQAGGISGTSFVPNVAGMNFFTSCAQQAKAAGLKIAWHMSDAFNNAAWSEAQFRDYNGQYWKHVSSRLGQYVDLWQVFNEHDGRDYRNHAPISLSTAYLDRFRDTMAHCRTQLRMHSNAPLTTTPFGYPIDAARYAKWIQFFDGIGSSLDVIGVHGYPEKSQTTINLMATYINNLKARYSKDVAILEFGLPTVSGYGTITEIGDAIVRQIHAIMSTDPFCATLYNLRDRGVDTNNGEMMFGIVNNAWAKKAHYNTVVGAVQQYKAV